MDTAPPSNARRVLMLPVGDHEVASTRYRVLAYLGPLREAGYSPTVRYGPRPRTGLLRYPARLFELCRDTFGSAGADLLFIHRKTFPRLCARHLARRRQPLVFDMDDALDLPPPSLRPSRRILRRFAANYTATVKAADLVLCGNAELAARLPHDRWLLLPTPVDCDRFRPDAIEPADGPALGWVGHSDNLRYLERLADPLRELASRHPGLRLVVAADRSPRLPGVRVEFRKWTLDREITCFSGMSVGLMPLDDTPWTRAKCSFKLLQYMALGIPAVASPVGMNREVVRHGVSGFLPRTPAEWVDSVDRLLADQSLARQVALTARGVVEARYSVAVVSQTLVEAVGTLLRSREAHPSVSRAEPRRS